MPKSSELPIFSIKLFNGENSKSPYLGETCREILHWV